MKQLLVILLFWLWAGAAFGQGPALQFDKILGVPLKYPTASVVDRFGNMYVADQHMVYRVNPFGQVVQRLVVAEERPEGQVAGLAVDATGNLYVVTYRPQGPQQHSVQKYSAAGELLLSFALTVPEGGQLPVPVGLGVDDHGNIVVADGRNLRILQFDRFGVLVRQFGGPGSQEGAFKSLQDVAVDGKGNIYVADAGNYRVQKFTADGEFGFMFGEMGDGPGQFHEKGSIGSLAVTGSGAIVGADGSGHRVQKFSPTGQYLLQIGRAGSGNGAFNDFVDRVSADAADNVYVISSLGSGQFGTIQKFDARGQFVQRWGGERYPNGVALDDRGNLYVADGAQGQVRKYSATGHEVLAFGSPGDGPGQFRYLSGIAVDRRGQIYTLEQNGPFVRVQKFTAEGRYLRHYDTFGPGETRGDVFSYLSFAVDAQENLYLAEILGGQIRKVNAAGQLVGLIGKPGEELGELEYPLAVTVDFQGNVYVLDTGGRNLLQYDRTGKYLRHFGPIDSPSGFYDLASDLAVDGRGHLYVAVEGRGYVQVYGPTGQALQRLPVNAHRVAVSPDGNRVALAEYNLDAVYLYQSPAIARPTNYITGTIFADRNNNCLPDPGEAGMANIPVIAEPGPYYGYTDDRGQYRIAVDTGTYTVRQVVPQQHGRTFVQLCPVLTTAHTVRFSSLGNTVADRHFGNRVVDAPFLSVAVASDRRRRCFTNTTTVTYANNGFAASDPTLVHLQLPEHVIFQSANRPYTRSPDGSVQFAVGVLQPGQMGTIIIQDSVSCADASIRGRTVCTQARITSATPNHYAVAAAWDQASVEVKGECLGDGTVRYEVANNGPGDMAESQTLRVYQDAQLAMEASYQLSQGETVVLRVPAEGQTVRVEATQTSGHPHAAQAAATVEACGRTEAGTFSTGQVLALPVPPPVAGPEEATDCLPILDSFDPNDKRVVPEGLTPERYTPTGTALHYQIRFQNTGNDVAYQVAVTDTLSKNLDLATLQVGAVSHPYRLEVSGQGRPVLTFTFDNILLPDSTTDETNSHGSIRFSIQPKTDLPEKALILNFADIFFDYNEPVRTDTTYNRIYDLPLPAGGLLPLNPETILTSPVITGFSPAEGHWGDTITLTGRHFSGTLLENQVSVNGVAAEVLQASGTSLQIRIPQGATTGTLSLRTPDGTTRTATPLAVLPQPILTALLPEKAKLSAMAQALRLYPNPHRGSFTIDWSQADFAVREIRIYNALGQLVYTSPPGENLMDQHLVQIMGAKSGVYVVVVQTSQGPLVKQVMGW